MNEHTCENCGDTGCVHLGSSVPRVCGTWRLRTAPRTLDDILDDYVSARRKRTNAAAELEQSEEAVRTLSEELREALEKVL